MHEYIELLKMEKHIEGGYFSVAYRSTDKVKPLHPRYRSSKGQELSDSVQRNAGSSIYYLLEKNDFAAWHRIRSDEIWHYYDGSSVNIHILTEAGEIETRALGNPCRHPGAAFQVVLPAGCWFAAELQNQEEFALMGCTVSPGFEYYDWELADKEKLAAEFPELPEFAKRFFRTAPTPASLSKVQNQN